MKEPKHVEFLYASIFLFVGIMFICMGLLSFAGVLTPTVHSKVQDPFTGGVIFCTIGIVFCVIQAVFRLLGKRKDTGEDELLSSGIRLSGTVEKIYLSKWIHYGKKSPYRIKYTFLLQEEIYHHKSYMLWEKPNYIEGDRIDVYANEFGQSTLKL